MYPHTTGQLLRFQLKSQPSGLELASQYIVKLLQSMNAQAPILVILFGLTILVRLPQPLNALSPILVIVLDIIVFIHPLINVLVAVSIIALQLSLESYILFPLSTLILIKLVQY